jgi:hypothetical protein
MTRHLPSAPAIRGLCAAFFLAAGFRAATSVLAINTTWQEPHLTTAFWSSLPAFILWYLFGAASALVGLRLLYDRAHCVPHGLVLGWLIFTVSLISPALTIYDLATRPSPPPAGSVFLFQSLVPALCSGAVLWLLYTLRPREQRNAEPLLNGAEVA